MPSGPSSVAPPRLRLPPPLPSMPAKETESGSPLQLSQKTTSAACARGASESSATMGTIRTAAAATIRNPRSRSKTKFICVPFLGAGNDDLGLHRLAGDALGPEGHLVGAARLGADLEFQRGGPFALAFELAELLAFRRFHV